MPKIIKQEDKQALVELVQEEIELHRKGELEKLSTNRDLVELIGKSRRSVIIILQSLKEDKNYRAKHLISQRAKKQWENPEYREMMTKVASQSLKKQWENPEYREIMSKVTSQNIRKLWRNPKFREMMSEMFKDPEYREDLSKRKIKQWENPEYREMMSEIREDPKLREKMSQGGRTVAKMNMNILYNGNNYHSSSEAAITCLFEKYLEWKVEKGKTWQVKNNGVKNGGIDFLLEDEQVFIGYHPPKPFYGKGGRRDLRSREEYQKFMRIKSKIRDEKSPERAREFQKRIENIISKKYTQSRLEAIEESEYAGTPLIYAGSIEDIYDKVISVYSQEPPERATFLSEFRGLVKEIRDENKKP